jgi:hypothetical protein
LKDLPSRISQEKVMDGSDISPDDLLKFPKFVKNQKKILIEFYDCIIKANDLVDF